MFDAEIPLHCPPLVISIEYNVDYFLLNVLKGPRE